MPALNIGCGLNNSFPEATHYIDCCAGDPLRHRVFVDYWLKISQFKDWNINELPLPYDNGFFEKVYMRHVLEHFVKDTGEKIIKDIHRILIPKGVLYVEVPDIHWLACQIAGNPDLYEKPMGCGYPAIEFIYGGGSVESLDAHRCGYTKLTLERLLINSGFQIISINRENNINLQMTARKI